MCLFLMAYYESIMGGLVMSSLGFICLCVNDFSFRAVPKSKMDILLSALPLSFFEELFHVAPLVKPIISSRYLSKIITVF